MSLYFAHMDTYISLVVSFLKCNHSIIIFTIVFIYMCGGGEVVHVLQPEVNLHKVIETFIYTRIILFLFVNIIIIPLSQIE